MNTFTTTLEYDGYPDDVHNEYQLLKHATYFLELHLECTDRVSAGEKKYTDVINGYNGISVSLLFSNITRVLQVQTSINDNAPCYNRLVPIISKGNKVIGWNMMHDGDILGVCVTEEDVINTVFDMVADSFTYRSAKYKFVGN